MQYIYQKVPLIRIKRVKLKLLLDDSIVPRHRSYVNLLFTIGKIPLNSLKPIRKVINLIINHKKIQEDGRSLMSFLVKPTERFVTKHF